jgi:hypothetical protein
MPESIVRVGGQLSFARETLKRRTFPYGSIVFNVVTRFRGKDKEAAIDPAVALGLFFEADYQRTVCDNRAEPAGRSNRGHCSEATLSAVKLQQRLNIDVGNSIAVGQKKIFVAKILANTLDPAAGHGVDTGIYQRNSPRFGTILMNFYSILGNVERRITDVEKVISEVAFNYISQIPAANHKIIDSAMRENFHDVPQNRHSADLDHRLGAEMALLADSGTRASRQNYGLQCFPPQRREMPRNPNHSLVYMDAKLLWQVDPDVLKGKKWSTAVRFPWANCYWNLEG